jgi:hypothetical protein
MTAALGDAVVIALDERAEAELDHCVFSDGSVYVGHWRDGTMHGSGICLFSSGVVFCGDWHHGLAHGRGLMLYANGDVFDGLWTDGACDGLGSLFAAADGQITVGTWQGGSLLAKLHMDSNTEMMSLLVAKRRALHSLSKAVASMSLRNMNLMNPKKDPTSALPSLRIPATEAQFASAVPDFATQSREPLSRPAVQLRKDPLKRELGVCAKDEKDPLTANHLLFTMSGPSYPFSFSPSRFVQYVGLFSFPFLSLPLRFMPLRLTTMHQEREFVVSGAAVRADFELPTWELYVAAVSIILTTASGIFGLVTEYHIRSMTPYSLSDALTPAALCILFSLLQAATHGYSRVPHVLERLDRQQFTHLAATSAQCVDAHCSPRVASWKDDGVTREVVSIYPKCWAALSALFATAMLFTLPAMRASRGQNFFAAESAFPAVGAICSACAVFLLSGAITYHLCRVVDMQRQVLSAMRVLTRCAYLRGQSVLHPTDRRKHKFDLDASLSLSSLKDGFAGWYVMRSFVLYASTCTNHRARHAYAGVLLGLMAAVDGLLLIHGTAAVISDDPVSFTGAHAMGLVMLLGWGTLLSMFIYASHHIDLERQRHCYLIDVASVFHQWTDERMSQLLTRCSGMVARHEIVGNIFGRRVGAVGVALWGLLQLLGLLGGLAVVVQWSRSRTNGAVYPISL